MSDPAPSSSRASTLPAAHRTSTGSRDEPAWGSQETRDTLEGRDSRSLPRHSPRHPSRSPDPGRAGDDRYMAANQREGSPRGDWSRGAVLPNGLKPKGNKQEKYEMRSNTALQEDSDEDDDDWC